jgi:hypothetical protein
MPCLDGIHFVILNFVMYKLCNYALSCINLVTYQQNSYMPMPNQPWVGGVLLAVTDHIQV